MKRRRANQNGLIDGAYPTNIHVGSVKARDGGLTYSNVTLQNSTVSRC